MSKKLKAGDKVVFNKTGFYDMTQGKTYIVSFDQCGENILIKDDVGDERLTGSIHFSKVEKKEKKKYVIMLMKSEYNSCTQLLHPAGASSVEEVAKRVTPMTESKAKALMERMQAQYPNETYVLMKLKKVEVE